MKRIVASLLLATAFTCTLAPAVGANIVAPKFRGDWVPAKAACTSPLKLVIGEKEVSFVNGVERASYPKLSNAMRAWATTCRTSFC